MKLKTILFGAAAVFSAGFVATPALAQNEPYIGQLMTTAATFCPRGWLQANGQILPISQNTALFSLLGTTYGGNGQTTFALPDLRGRVPVGQGTGPGLSAITLGQIGGSEAVTLTVGQMPAHSHTATLLGSSAVPDSEKVKKSAFATFAPGSAPIYNRTIAPTIPMAAGSVVNGETGGNQPVGIRDPYLGLRYCIAVEGIFPSQN